MYTKTDFVYVPAANVDYNHMYSSINDLQ